MKIKIGFYDMYHSTGIHITWPNWLGDFFHQCHRWKQSGFRKGFCQKPWKNQYDQQWSPEEIERLKKRNAEPLDINRIKGE